MEKQRCETAHHPSTFKREITFVYLRSYNIASYVRVARKNVLVVERAV